MLFAIIKEVTEMLYIFFLVASRRSSEELIFGGKVTVNGSVCNTPQVIACIVMFSICIRIRIRFLCICFFRCRRTV